MPKDAGITFDITIRLDLSRLADWEPGRITALIEGVGKLVALSGAVQETAPLIDRAEEARP